MKYKKDVVDQQLSLKKIANCAIHLYAMVAVVSRATRALENKYPTADHEALLANAFCKEASDFISSELRHLKSGYTDKDIKAIAEQIFSHEEYAATHPLNL